MHAGLTIIDFTSDNAALYVSNGATVLLNSCTFARNVISNQYENSGVISVNAVDPNFSDKQEQDTILRLEKCIFTGNTAPHSLAATSEVSIFLEHDVSVFSDEPMDVYVNNANPSMGTTLPLAQGQAERPGIDASTDWFVTAQKARNPRF